MTYITAYNDVCVFVYAHVACTQPPLVIRCCKTEQGEPCLNALCALCLCMHSYQWVVAIRIQPSTSIFAVGVLGKPSGCKLTQVLMQPCSNFPTCTTVMALAVKQDACAMQAVSSGLVNVLLPCLTQGSLSLACATLEALMQITIAVQGKQAMVRIVTQSSILIFMSECAWKSTSQKISRSCLTASRKRTKSLCLKDQAEGSVMSFDITYGDLAQHHSLLAPLPNIRAVHNHVQ